MPADFPPLTALSLQDKLDRIAHERDVLALLRVLADGGLREGDTVRAVTGDRRGRLQVARDQSPPRLRVVDDDGTTSDYTTALWRRA